MSRQSYSKHKKTVPIYHYFLLPFVVLVTIASVANALIAVTTPRERAFSAFMILSLSIAMLLLVLLTRAFSLKAQNRAIRAEENMRHFALAGRLLDTRLTLRQIIALRFASDAEFPELARKAAEMGMKADEIKRAIKNWKGDLERV